MSTFYQIKPEGRGMFCGGKDKFDRPCPSRLTVSMPPLEGWWCEKHRRRELRKIANAENPTTETPIEAV